MAFLADVFAPLEPIRFSTLARSFRDYRRRNAVRRRILNELSALSDRELNDLNISRFDFRQIADEAARRA